MDARELKQAILAELPDIAERKRLHDMLEDCGCSYKDCYYCGMRHNCIHQPEVTLSTRIKRILDNVD